MSYGFGLWRISRLGAVLRHATPRASRILSIFALEKYTFVFPRRPHAPLTGRNTAGSARTKLLCPSGVSLIIPPLFIRITERREDPAVHAKIRMAHVGRFNRLRET